MNRVFEALGFDPAPGSPDAVATQAELLGEVGGQLEQVGTLLSRAAAETWQGQSAQAFGEVLDEQLVPRVDEAVAALAEGAQALQTYAEELMDFQRRAETLESEAQAQRDIRDAAAREADAAPSPETDHGGGGEHAAASERVAEAETELERIDREAQALAAEVDERIQLVTTSLPEPSLGVLTDTTGLEPLGSTGVEEVEETAAAVPELAGITETLTPMLGAAPALVGAGLRFAGPGTRGGRPRASMGDVAERLSAGVGTGSAFDLATLRVSTSSPREPADERADASAPVTVRFDAGPEAAEPLAWVSSGVSSGTNSGNSSVDTRADIDGTASDAQRIGYDPSRGTPSRGNGVESEVDPG